MYKLITAEELPFQLSNEVIQITASYGTCQKRRVICLLFDNADNLISTGVNTCQTSEPCPRLSYTSNYTNYPADTCQSEHAEEQAISNNYLFGRRQPKTAVLLGHSFPCPSCEDKISNEGISQMFVIQNWPGTGLCS